jgi:hypothetical protein
VIGVSIERDWLGVLAVLASLNRPRVTRAAQEQVRPDKRVSAEPKHRAAGRLLTDHKGDEIADSLEGKSFDQPEETPPFT